MADNKKPPASDRKAPTPTPTRIEKGTLIHDHKKIDANRDIFVTNKVNPPPPPPRPGKK